MTYFPPFKKLDMFENSPPTRVSDQTPMTPDEKNKIEAVTTQRRIGQLETMLQYLSHYPNYADTVDDWGLDETIKFIRSKKEELATLRAQLEKE